MIKMVRNGPNTEAEETKEKTEQKNNSDSNNSSANVSREDWKKQEKERIEKFSGDYSEEKILEKFKKDDNELYKNAKNYEDIMKILRDGNDDEIKSGRNPDLYSFLLENKKKFEEEKNKKEIEKKKEELKEDKKSEKDNEKKNEKEKPENGKEETKKSYDKDEKKTESKENGKEDSEKKPEAEKTKEKKDDEKKNDKDDEKKSEVKENDKEDNDTEAEDKKEKSGKKGFFGAIGSLFKGTSKQAGNLIRYVPRTAWNSVKMVGRSLRYFGFDILNFPSGGKAMEIFWKKYSDDMKRYKGTFKWNYKKGGK